MAKNTINQLMNLVKGLSEKEQKNIVDQIMGMLQSNDNSRTISCNDMVSEHLNEKPDCPHCHSKADMGYVVKRGYRRGVQRFYCKNCGKTFVATTNTAFERSRKDADLWKKFIKLTIEGRSLADCSEECGIAYQTAFTWRHKILNVFKVNQSDTQMTGDIQVDEMLVKISYKGNHYKGFHTKGQSYKGLESPLPRKSYKRGTDNKSRSSKDKACVFCMVDGSNKQYYGAVPGAGFMKENMLDSTLAKHVKKENSVIIADQYKITEKYLKDNNYNHMILASNTAGCNNEHIPEIRDGFHMQNVNSMHHHLRLFLTKYYGISTKYLENYISLFVWVKNATANKQKRRLQNLSLRRAASSDCYITRKALESLPAVPVCA